MPSRPRADDRSPHSGYPSLNALDANGKLRLADCANGNVEKAIEILLAE